MQTAPAMSRTDRIVSSPTRYRWVVLSLIFIVYTLAAADRANIGIVLPSLKREFAMSNTEAGAVVSLFFVGYALMQIPGGFIVRRFGPRRIFPLFMILTSTFTGLLGFVGSVAALKLNRLALGLAEGPLPISMLTTMNRWFPPQEKGSAVGVYLAAAKFGPVLAPPLGALIISAYGWEHVFFFCAVPGVLFAALWYVLVSDDPARSRFVSAAEVAHIRADGVAEQTQAVQQPQGLSAARRTRLDRILRSRPVTPIPTAGRMFRSSDIWGLALCYMLMTGIINVILAWLPLYLTNVKHFALMNVGFIASAPFVGGVAGNLVGGWLSDRVLGKRRKPTILISAVSTVFMMYALVHAPNEAKALAVLLFLTGFLLNIGYSAFAVYPAGLVTMEVFPLAAGAVGTGGQAGGALFPFLAGLLLDAADWNAVFLFLGGASLLTFAVMLLVVDPIETPAVRVPQTP